ncbi:hypothetical protein QTP88_019070 [Uroleucon formosanum]
MATGTKVSLDKVTGMIPICTGERDVHQFIRACELACSMTSRLCVHWEPWTLFME